MIFYVTRLYENRRERTLVVFQKPHAWDVIGGGISVQGSLETILELLPKAVEIEHRGIIMIVVDYEIWKDMVRQKQLG